MGGSAISAQINDTEETCDRLLLPGRYLSVGVTVLGNASMAVLEGRA